MRAFLFIVLLFPITLIAANKNPVALQIAILDGQGITKHGVREREVYLAPLNSRVISIVVDTKPYGVLFPQKSDMKIRTELLEKLRALKIAEDEVITTVVFHTHGSSDDQHSKLWKIGKLLDDGPDLHLRQVVDKFVKYLSPTANVVLEACNTLCGTKQNSFQRIHHFMDYMGISHGKFFGAITPISNISDNVNGLTSKERVTIGGLTFMVYSGLTATSFVADIPDLNQMTILSGSFAFATLLTLAEIVRNFALKPIIELKEKFKKVNVGWMYQFKNSQQAQVHEVVFYRDIEVIYDWSSCSEFLNEANSSGYK